MAIYFPETEDIYFSKTKEYFREVVSSYANGNYRSAIVMLYSVAICDILFKLQELKDMYNDSVAIEILNEVDKAKNPHDNKSKSKWEKELLDSVLKRTSLLNLESHTNLSHLYDYRNFSAHPALNDNYELISPTKETTVACIKNTLNDVLIKPPIFIKNTIEMLTEDIKGKSEIYRNAYDRLSTYLNNKYYSKMTNSMKCATIKAFWKFCFCLPDNEECKANLKINRKALEVLTDSFDREAMEYIRDNKERFDVASDDSCMTNLVLYLSKFPQIYTVLNDDTQLRIDDYIKRVPTAKMLAWFKYSAPKDHFEYLKSTSLVGMDYKVIKRVEEHYLTNGECQNMIDCFICIYSKSGSYNTADIRFEALIESNLDKMNHDQIKKLIEESNNNRQIWDRWGARSANNKIYNVAKLVLGEDFDYSQYPNFKYDAPNTNESLSEGSCEAFINF